MSYWRPLGQAFIPGVPMVNYSDAAMLALEKEHPGVRESGAFERVGETMPAGEPRVTPAAVEALSEEEGQSDD